MGTGSGDGGGLFQFVGLDCEGDTVLGKAGPRCDSDGYAEPWLAEPVCCALAADTQLSNAVAIMGIRNISASLDAARSFRSEKALSAQESRFARFQSAEANGLVVRVSNIGRRTLMLIENRVLDLILRALE